MHTSYTNITVQMFDSAVGTWDFPRRVETYWRLCHLSRVMNIIRTYEHFAWEIVLAYAHCSQQIVMSMKLFGMLICICPYSNLLLPDLSFPLCIALNHTVTPRIGLYSQRDLGG